MFMKKPLWRRMLSGFLFVSLTGVLLHYAYDWSGEGFYVAPFSGVNESTWEHMKLLFFPLFVWGLVESVFIAKKYPSFWCAKLVGILAGLVFIPVAFYTIRGVFGTSPDWVNISLFFVAAAVAFLTEAALLRRRNTPCPSPELALLLLCLLALLFVVFTWAPPAIPLFQDPITGGYGVTA